MNLVNLVTLAREAQKFAYAPYSGFKVGAALLTEAGNVYSGANVENASYGLTVCAERIAVFKAVTAGELKFQAIAVVGSGRDYLYPCGACLQVLAEFSTHIRIVAVNENDDFREYYLGDLLPQVFSIDTRSGRVK